MFQPLKTRQGFQTLGPRYFAPVLPTPLSSPYWVSVNNCFADELGLHQSWHQNPNWLELLSGQSIPKDIQPIATCYSGHQFGYYNPQLGDGRAHLLTEMQDKMGKWWELQLKGSGPTPFSRHADGRAVLRSSIREYLCSENLNGLGIPSTRALGLVGSPDPVYRETTETAATVLRMSPSFLRFGHLEYYYHTGQQDSLSDLLDYVVQHYYSELQQADNPILAFFEQVVQRTAVMVAHWQAQGWCHGVMNTDNFSLLGETIDFGPFGFIDTFDPTYICNHSDTQGRYAYNQQPGIAHWNLVRLGQTLTPFATIPELQQALEGFESAFETQYDALMCEKLGLPIQAAIEGTTQPKAQNKDLTVRWLDILEANQWDYHWTLRRLSEIALHETPLILQAALKNGDEYHETFNQWWADYCRQGAHSGNQRQDRMMESNPWIVLRNWVAQEAIEAAQAGDFQLVQELLKALQQPFKEHPQLQRFHERPQQAQQALVLSCSS